MNVLEKFRSAMNEKGPYRKGKKWKGSTVRGREILLLAKMRCKRNNKHIFIYSYWFQYTLSARISRQSNNAGGTCPYSNIVQVLHMYSVSYIMNKIILCEKIPYSTAKESVMEYLFPLKLPISNKHIRILHTRALIFTRTVYSFLNKTFIRYACIWALTYGALRHP